MRIQLPGATIRGCPDIPHELKYFMKQPLWHQIELYQQAKDAHILLDLAPTGTGKTEASFLTLKHNPQKHAIYLAPTNALVKQQAEAAQKFVKKADLPHWVLPANAAEIRGWPGPSRPGEKLYNLLREPATIFPEAAHRPVLLVTNPDIFYYAIFFGYQRLDRFNIASSFINSFFTIIIDEFHLYDAKQIVSLIFYLILSYVFGYFEYGRKIILLTATPEPACEALLNRLEEKGIKIAKIDGNDTKEPQIPSQTQVVVDLSILPPFDTLPTELTEEVVKQLQIQPDSYGAVILDSLDQINRLADQLKLQGINPGKITGPAGSKERINAMGKQVILATQTVDVGFNFERSPNPQRQNLDWILFSASDRSSFWQRLGRVGRVLGKQTTQIPSYAKAYFQENIWQSLCQCLQEGLITRQDLVTQLLEIPAIQRPFQDVYWRTEALLEVARPILQMERNLRGLEQESKVQELFEDVRDVVAQGRGHKWGFYRYRLQMIEAAEAISHNPRQGAQNPGSYSFIQAFLKDQRPEDWIAIEEGSYSLHDFIQAFKEEEGPEAIEARQELQIYAQRFQAIYQPIFRFRQSQFGQQEVYDPQNLLTDLSDEVSLDILHLLRNYEFKKFNHRIELLSRPLKPYQIQLFYSAFSDRQTFENQLLNRPTALKPVSVHRTFQGATQPTPLAGDIAEDWLPGVIICKMSNAQVCGRLYRAGIYPFNLTVAFNDGQEREYSFYSHLSGWLALAQEGVRLRLPETEDSWII